MKIKLALACVLLVACRYGGSDEDPLLGLAPGDDVDGEPLLDATISGNVASPSSQGAMPAMTSASRPDAGKSPVTGGVDSGKAHSGSKPANACAPEVDTCDPVRNTGCPPLMQCDIDTSATTPTGNCVFAMMPTGGDCSASFVSETCPPQFTCALNQCRKLCYCDEDCGAGACCSDASGPGPAGFFKLCQPC